MQTHNLVLTNREFLEVSGVTYVSSFDDREVVLDTGQGSLHVIGEDLNISQLSLDQGNVVIQGKIMCMEYKATAKSMKGKGKSLVNRILK
ncbi:MAG: sporulation protein YabP [Syntrophomonadaceae bacterium]|nr:sporulation protein YabP [Syntrophomonadaceae bacterium]